MLRGVFVVMVVTAAVTAGSAVATSALAESTFTVNGEVTGLYPGLSTTLPATVTNPFDTPIRVTAIVAGVVGVAPPGCPAAAVTVHSVAPGTVVAPRGTALVEVGVELDAGAPDACQGATFDLAFAGTAAAAAPPDATDGLAFTGADPRVLVGAAALLLGAGFVARRARRRGAAARDIDRSSPW